MLNFFFFINLIITVQYYCLIKARLRPGLLSSIFCNLHSHLVFNNLPKNPYYNYLDQMESYHYTTTEQVSVFYRLIVLYYLIFFLFSRYLFDWDESCTFCSNREFFTECDCFFFHIQIRAPLAQRNENVFSRNFQVISVQS